MIRQQLMPVVLAILLQLSVVLVQSQDSCLSDADDRMDAISSDMLGETTDLFLLQTRSQEIGEGSARADGAPEEGKRAIVPGKNLFVVPEKKVIVCACAKCGSTSMFRYMYSSLTGKQWTYTTPPWVHYPSKRWEGQLEHIDSAKALTMMETKQAFGFALVRDPRERIVSAWKSKAACGTCWSTDVRDRSRLVPQLLKFARDTSQVECLSFDKFVELLAKIHEEGTEGELDRHLVPQQADCFKDIPADKWSMTAPITDSRAAQKLAAQLGDVNFTQFPHTHGSSHTETCHEVLVGPGAQITVDRLSAITKAEYLALGMDSKSRSDLVWLQRQLGA